MQNENNEKKYEKKYSKDPEKRREKKYVKDPEKRFEKNAEKRYAKEPEKRFEKNAEKRYVKDPEKRFEKNTEKRYVKDPEKRFEKNAEKRYVKDPEKRFEKKFEKRSDMPLEGRTERKPAGIRKGSCVVSDRCGGCQLQGVPYKEQLLRKQARMEELLSSFGKVEPIIGMENPLNYRNKVHHVFSEDRNHNVISGSYEANSHLVVRVDDCMIEDKKCQEIMHTIRKLVKSFKIRIYNEDAGYGLLRHVLIRRGFLTDEIMVVLVLTSPVLPSKNNFSKALREAHPEIRSIVINVNDKDTSMVLGKRDIPLYGAPFIRDQLMGLKFRISPQSFYQVNPVQTEVLYKTAIRLASLNRKETAIDAYCGIGTIGLSAARSAKKIIGIELNPDAVRDARLNAAENNIQNAEFFQGDAGEWMQEMAAQGETADVVFMDPPRSGSTETFMKAAVAMKPSRIVYVSCGPDTLKRDLEYMEKLGYKIKTIQPIDMFPMTDHVETVVLLSKKHVNPKAYVEIGVDAEEYYKIKEERK